jgi:hypothetical protein
MIGLTDTSDCRYYRDFRYGIVLGISLYCPVGFILRQLRRGPFAPGAFKFPMANWTQL